MSRFKITGTSKIIETICNGDDPIWEEYSQRNPNERSLISIEQCEQIYFRWLKAKGVIR